MDRKTFLQTSAALAVGGILGDSIINKVSAAETPHSATDGALDFPIMDLQIVPKANGYGEDVMIWEYATYIDDAEAFMEHNMAHYLNILTGDEPLDIFACPLLLPYCIERKYNRLWTKKRLQRIIDAAKARDIAIEISDMMRVPDEEFILMAKRAGLKFTFGSDTRDEKTGRLDYCRRVAVRCGLKKEDMFVPKRKL